MTGDQSGECLVGYTGGRAGKDTERDNLDIDEGERINGSLGMAVECVYIYGWEVAHGGFSRRTHRSTFIPG